MLYLSLSVLSIVLHGTTICNYLLGQSPRPARVWAGGGGAAVRD